MSGKKRNLAGSVGIGVFFAGLICVCVAWVTPSWLVSDYRITGAKLDKLGLWNHCFRSLPDPQNFDAPTRYFVGCRWVYDPFTAGYSEIRGFLVPAFMATTQFFFTLCFVCCLVSFGLIMLFTLCCLPEQQRYVQLILAIGSILTAGGTSGVIGVLVFGFFGNTNGWMPGHANNFFGYSFILAIVGALLTLIAGALFLVEANIQAKKRKNLRESQTRFQLSPREMS